MDEKIPDDFDVYDEEGKTSSTEEEETENVSKGKESKGKFSLKNLFKRKNKNN